MGGGGESCSFQTDTLNVTTHAQGKRSLQVISPYVFRILCKVLFFKPLKKLFSIQRDFVHGKPTGSCPMCEFAPFRKEVQRENNSCSNY